MLLPLIGKMLSGIRIYHIPRFKSKELDHYELFRTI